MFVKKKVYICDYCGDAVLPRTELVCGVLFDCMHAKRLDCFGQRASLSDLCRGLSQSF